MNDSTAHKFLQQLEKLNDNLGGIQLSLDAIANKTDRIADSLECDGAVQRQLEHLPALAHDVGFTGRQVSELNRHICELNAGVSDLFQPLCDISEVSSSVTNVASVIDKHGEGIKQCLP